MAAQQCGGRYSWGDGGGEDEGRPPPCESSPRAPRSPGRLAALHLPAYVRRKLAGGQGAGGRVASTGSLGSSEGGFRTPYGPKEAYQDPSRSPFRDPSRSPYRDTTSGSPYKEPPRDPHRSPYRDPPYLREFSTDPYRDPGGDPFRDRGKDPQWDSLRDPLVYPIRDPLRSSLRDLGGYGAYHPQDEDRPARCYLDLFDPSVPVIRDPALDRPQTPRLPLWRDVTRKLTPLWGNTRRLGACLVVLLLLLVVVVTVTALMVMRGGEEGDPRYQHPHVTAITACGLVRGRMQQRHLFFQGVPYAVPPSSSLQHRFRPALPITRLSHCWNGTYSADVTRRCWHYDQQGNTVEGSEDCLRLDIYTPKLGYDTPLPVVVYIGGSSMGGDSHRDYLSQGFGPTASDRNLVIVYPNIRRGPLGIMAHPRVAEDVYPLSGGGQAASDVVAALTWVSRNIEHFGGDPNSVTLLGHRAGAALAYPLLSSVKLKGLVHRAWLSGAPPLHPHVSWRDAPASLARPYNCSELRCLQETPARALMESLSLDYRKASLDMPWLVADGVFVSLVPSAPKVPVMFGTTLHAAAEALLPFRGGVEAEEPLHVHPLQKLEEAVQRVLSSALTRASNTSYSDDTSYYSRYPKDSAWYRPPPPVPQFPHDEAKAAVKLYSQTIEDPWILLVTLISDAMYTCPFLDIAGHLSRDATVPPYRSRPSATYLSEQHHIIASSGHPALVHQSSYSIYTYLSTQTRLSPLGNLSDANSDIDAIFGVFPGEGDSSTSSSATSNEEGADKGWSDRSYADRLQDMFSLFVELGQPERSYATPAHLGAYVIRSDIEIEKRRTMCKFWERWKDLAKRY